MSNGPKSDKPDATVCGPCVWMKVPDAPPEVTEADYFDACYILDAYLRELHRRFNPNKKVLRKPKNPLDKN